MLMLMLLLLLRLSRLRWFVRAALSINGRCWSGGGGCRCGVGLGSPIKAVFRLAGDVMGRQAAQVLHCLFVCLSVMAYVVLPCLLGGESCLWFSVKSARGQCRS
ncbi:hypothetical protein JDV02_010873 [Purpureocillium takamizusanense]|uniref:Secreted protein n=1 Tax=Purpureocillium takamizusanense TaxID=2060973 RepID=A0A9Q8QNX7_9HYPO|nr:uncharacterized protein JDV02_010873 [Purpureocillium takamizusanense]UNI22139.1 hypothetical protein JDV02_010873 [Purpureocillium takamizusanense]